MDKATLDEKLDRIFKIERRAKPIKSSPEYHAQVGLDGKARGEDFVARADNLGLGGKQYTRGDAIPAAVVASVPEDRLYRLLENHQLIPKSVYDAAAKHGDMAHVTRTILEPLKARVGSERQRVQAAQAAQLAAEAALVDKKNDLILRKAILAKAERELETELDRPAVKQLFGIE